MSALPTFAQVAALPVVVSHTVGAEHLDANEHMNIGHYFTWAGEALWRRHDGDFAMGPGYITDRGLTTFTVEQNIRYLAESVLGDELDVAAIVVDRGPRSVHFLSLVTNRTRGSLAAVMETLTVHVDFTTRRPTPFPDDVASALDAAIDGDRPDWPLPLSGVLGIRR